MEDLEDSVTEDLEDSLADSENKTKKKQEEREPYILDKYCLKKFPFKNIF